MRIYNIIELLREAKLFFMKITKKTKSFYSPTPEEWKTLRLAYGLTQTQIGELVCSALRTVQGWENGSRKIPPMAWELIRIKLNVGEKETRDGERK